MNNDDPTAPLVLEAEQQVKTKRLPTVGFHTNPERINKNGAPKKEWTMAGILHDALEEQDETGVPFKKIIIKKLRTLAMRGDLQAIKEVLDRIDGKSKESLEVQGQVGFTVILKREP